jgi:hypothetical protein
MREGGVRRSATQPDSITLSMSPSLVEHHTHHHQHQQQQQQEPKAIGSGAPPPARSTSALGYYTSGGSKLSMSVDGSLLSAAGKSASQQYAAVRLSGTGHYLLGNAVSQDLSWSMNRHQHQHHHHPSPHPQVCCLMPSTGGASIDKAFAVGKEVEEEHIRLLS